MLQLRAWLFHSLANIERIIKFFLKLGPWKENECLEAFDEGDAIIKAKCQDYNYEQFDSVLPILEKIVVCMLLANLFVAALCFRFKGLRSHLIYFECTISAVLFLFPTE